MLGGEWFMSREAADVAAGARRGVIPAAGSCGWWGRCSAGSGFCRGKLRTLLGAGRFLLWDVAEVAAGARRGVIPAAGSYGRCGRSSRTGRFLLRGPGCPPPCSLRLAEVFVVAAGDVCPAGALRPNRPPHGHRRWST
ncbi:predicted protein [Streptomyces sp. AA4]|nr:predicted protein [Streptomyces sp. AA4]